MIFPSNHVPEILTQLTIKYPSPGVHSMTLLLLAPIYSYPQLSPVLPGDSTSVAAPEIEAT